MHCIEREGNTVSFIDLRSERTFLSVFCLLSAGNKSQDKTWSSYGTSHQSTLIVDCGHDTICKHSPATSENLVLM